MFVSDEQRAAVHAKRRQLEKRHGFPTIGKGGRSRRNRALLAAGGTAALTGLAIYGGRRVLFHPTLHRNFGEILKGSAKMGPGTVLRAGKHGPMGLGKLAEKTVTGEIVRPAGKMAIERVGKLNPMADEKTLMTWARFGPTPGRPRLGRGDTGQLGAFVYSRDIGALTGMEQAAFKAPIIGKHLAAAAEATDETFTSVPWITRQITAAKHGLKYKGANAIENFSLWNALGRKNDLAERAHQMVKSGKAIDFDAAQKLLAGNQRGQEARLFLLAERLEDSSRKAMLKGIDRTAQGLFRHRAPGDVVAARTTEVLKRLRRDDPEVLAGIRRAVAEKRGHVSDPFMVRGGAQLRQAGGSGQFWQGDDAVLTPTLVERRMPLPGELAERRALIKEVSRRQHRYARRVAEQQLEEQYPSRARATVEGAIGPLERKVKHMNDMFQLGTINLARRLGLPVDEVT